MKRGEIWTVSGGKEYSGKPRPAVIVQDDAFDATASVTICAFTTDTTAAPLFRLPVDPTEQNGLRSASRLMVDKITTVSKEKVGALVGRLADDHAAASALCKGADGLQRFTQLNRRAFELETPLADRFPEGEIFREDRPPVPADALCEVLLNAVMHRDYSTPSGYITVAVFVRFKAQIGPTPQFPPQVTPHVALVVRSAATAPAHARGTGRRTTCLF